MNSTQTEIKPAIARSISHIKIGMRVESGNGEDYDSGTVDVINLQTGMATVRWDSLVVTAAPISNLREAP
jgi:hypothetical protein